MTGGSYRGRCGGMQNPTSQLEAKPITVDWLIFQKVTQLGNGVLVHVQMHIATFVKKVSK